jgi:GTP cyclohydrolase II
MTNNPGKLSALRAEGIELVDHVTLNSTVNPHNERYLRAKRERSGHL